MGHRFIFSMVIHLNRGVVEGDGLGGGLRGDWAPLLKFFSFNMWGGGGSAPLRILAHRELISVNKTNFQQLTMIFYCLINKIQLLKCIYLSYSESHKFPLLFFFVRVSHAATSHFDQSFQILDACDYLRLCDWQFSSAFSGSSHSISCSLLALPVNCALKCNAWQKLKRIFVILCVLRWF